MASGEKMQCKWLGTTPPLLIQSPVLNSLRLARWEVELLAEKMEAEGIVDLLCPKERHLLKNHRERFSSAYRRMEWGGGVLGP